MAEQRLVNYVKSELLRGSSLQQIKQGLISQGWSDYDVTEAVNLATQQRAFPAVTAMHEGPAKSPKPWIIPALAAAVIIIGGVFTFFMLAEKGTQKAATPATKPLGPTDCGTNMDCLITASQNCKPAKVAHGSTVNLFGILITTTGFYEIKGTEANKCILYLRTESQDIDFSEELVQQMLDGGATEEEIRQQKQESNKQAELVEGMDGTCRFKNNADLTSLLSKWKEGTSSGGFSCSHIVGEMQCTNIGDLAVADCNGVMFAAQLSQ